eukprot:1188196-Prorocentrum_minimum.AAC.6
MMWRLLVLSIATSAAANDTRISDASASSRAAWPCPIGRSAARPLAAGCSLYSFRRPVTRMFSSSTLFGHPRNRGEGLTLRR